MSRKLRLIIIGGIVIGLAAGVYFLFLSLSHKGLQSLTVSELKLQGSSVYNQWVKVTGEVAPGSISRDEKAQATTFALADSENSLNIVYKGVIPDDFKPRVKVTMVGQYQTDGVFAAESFEPPKSLCALCH